MNSIKPAITQDAETRPVPAPSSDAARRQSASWAPPLMFMLVLLFMGIPGYFLFEQFKDDARLKVAQSFAIATDLKVAQFREQAAKRGLEALSNASQPTPEMNGWLQSGLPPGKTVEAALFRVEGGNITYLYPQHPITDTSRPTINAPLDHATLLAAKALREQAGILEGTDTRGVAVIGMVHKIPDSSWFLQIKMDTEELYAPLNARAYLLMALMTVAGLLFTLCWIRFWRQQTTRHLSIEHQEKLERQALSHHYDYLARYATDIIQLTDDTGAIVEINDAAVAIYGYSREELLKMNVRDLQSLETSNAQGEDQIGLESGKTYETLHKRKDGSLFPVEISGRLIEIDGKYFHQCILRDISARWQTEEQIHLYAKAFDHSRDGIVITDVQTSMLMVNRSFSEITGYASAEAIGQTLALLACDHHPPDFYHAMWATVQKTGFWQGEVWSKRRNGEIYPEWLTLSAVRNAQGAITHYIGVFSDISERKAAEEHINYLAHYDNLTGLPNRVLMEDRLTQALRTAQRSGNKAGLMFLDLDRFKAINDSFGHPVGDLLLQAVARRLTECVRLTDTVSRLSGDEFVIILPDLDDYPDAAHVAEKIIASLSAPYSIENHNISITPSIGIALYPNDAQDMTALIRNADTAMYHAKENGRGNYQFFTADLNAQNSERLALEKNLHLALERKEFSLHYQPQVSMRNGHIVGIEALLRWQHPQLGMIPPAKFIPVAEESGLIAAIGEYVLREACRQNHAWQLQGLLAVPIAINVSAVQFHAKNFSRTIARALTETGLASRYLELELTERVVMRHGDATVDALNELKSLGVMLSIDDFGTGYSSLSYLKRFPIDRLKIDQSFVRDLATDSSDMEIVRAVIALGHNLDLKVIAEGVEDKEQSMFLRAEQCDSAQGYYFSHPLPAEEFARLLRADPCLPEYIDSGFQPDLFPFSLVSPQQTMPPDSVHLPNASADKKRKRRTASGNHARKNS